jgi:hypothetical protein
MSNNLQVKSPANQNDSHLLDETQAASLAGVTVDTIHRYRDFGLLRVVDKDGRDFFEEVDIRNLFYTKKQSQGQSQVSDQVTPAEEQKESAEPIQSSSIEPNSNSFGLEFELEESGEPSDTSSSNSVEDESSNSLDDRSNDNSSSKITENFFSQSEQKSSSQVIVDERPVSSLKTENRSDKQSDEAFPSTFPDSERDALNELNMTLKEQLETVRQERDWLRQRIERLETRSEREQMLLLTESQTLKSVLADSGYRKTESFWRKALPWIKG